MTPEGKTEAMALKTLSSACRLRAWETFSKPEISAVVKAVWRMAKEELVRLMDLKADGCLTDESCAQRRTRIFATFRHACQSKGVS